MSMPATRSRRDRAARASISAALRCGAPAVRADARWSGRSSSSTRSARRVSAGSGHRRPAASAYRPGDRHLSVRRRDPAPRQPGHLQPIRPGEVNWMTAGRGIVHSERTAPELRHGAPGCSASSPGSPCPSAMRRPIRASPITRRAICRAFEEGKRVRLVVGVGFGMSAPVRTFSDMVYADVRLEPGAGRSRADHSERAALCRAQGSVEVGGRPLRRRAAAGARAGDDDHVIGASDRRGCCWWAASRWTDPPSSGGTSSLRSPDRIEQAKADWNAGRFETVPGIRERVHSAAGDACASSPIDKAAPL